MSEGQNAAEETKSVLKDIGGATESLRKNINSYADDILGGNREHGSTGIHPDAQKTGEKIEQALGGTDAKTKDSVQTNNPRTTTS